MSQIEIHPFEPYVPDEARFLFLGTFPPKPEKWSMEFFYINNLYMLIISLINIFSWY